MDRFPFNVAFADGCPVDHKNMSEEQIAALMAQYKQGDHPLYKKQHGPASPYPLSSDEKHPQQQPSLSSQSQTASSAEASFAQATTAASTTQDPASQQKVYDVYGQELDQSNLMPSTPNQLPSPGQKSPLSTDRVKSSIPKSFAHDGTTWLYPSPQMFFNALRRKGKGHDVDERDMPTVVAVHNRMNERTWNEVMRWEKLFHCEQCDAPKLKRFNGRPHDLSPVARFRMWFRGYPHPFDRHDWVIDRCGEEEARYVIDYYYRDGPDPIELHVRPAVDSFSAVLDRMRAGAYFVASRIGAIVPAGYAQLSELPSALKPASAPASSPTPPAVVQGDHIAGGEFDFLASLTASRITDIGRDVQKRCVSAHQALATAGDDLEELEKANISLNYCMAQSICKKQADGFMAALENGGDESTAYTQMTSCLDRFQIMARRTLLDAAGVVQSGPEFPKPPPSVSRPGVSPQAAQPSPSAVPASRIES